MSDYFHASDLQAALAALTSIQEFFHEMYRIFTDSITEQRRIFLVFGDTDKRRKILRMRSDMAQTLLRHRMHADFLSSKRGIKSEDSTPLLRLLFRQSSCKRSLRIEGGLSCASDSTVVLCVK
jgi:hypothetical protein